MSLFQLLAAFNKSHQSPVRHTHTYIHKYVHILKIFYCYFAIKLNSVFHVFVFVVNNGIKTNKVKHFFEYT